MSPWQVAREQWLAWIEAGPSRAGSHPIEPLHALDTHLQDRLRRHPFPVVDDEATISRPGLAEDVVGAFESRPTIVRHTADDDEADELTQIHREPPAPSPPPPSASESAVEVGPRDDGLEISLQPAHEQTVVAAAPAAVAGETVVVEAPIPAGPPFPPEPLPDGPEPAIAAPVPAVDGTPWADGRSITVDPGSDAHDADDDGLFIPTLTRTMLVPEPVPASDEPPPDELPPVITGQTVVGPPPAPPEGYQAPPDVPVAASSGLITAEPDESAQTLIRGEIPARHGQPEADAAVPRTSKVVIDPSASGVLSAVYDEDDDDDHEDPEEATVLDDEPDELDADDLVEDDEEDEVAEPDSGPPPAPSRPPPAPDHEASGPRGPRPAIDIGPPPPPVPTAQLDAALSALPSAPAVDDGWQIDAFGEHHGALVSPLRAGAVASEVEFMLHCMGLGPGATVLDIGCGDGAHCVALGARGLSVTGLDASPVQLMRASQAAQAHGVTVELVSGDMRQPPVDGSYDGILCIGGTLGMFTDEDDRIALQHMRDRLVPGGRLMLHVLNRDSIVGRLPARSWWQGQGCLVLDEAQMFAPTSRVHVHRTVVFETGKQFEHNIGLRLYGLTELVQLCAQVGLRVLEYSGSRHTRGRFYGATSSEIWLLAQRHDG